MNRSETDKIGMRRIVKDHDQVEAVDMLIEHGFCVSKAEGRRVYHQLGGKQPEPIDFIKWLCEKAEGFESFEDQEGLNIYCNKWGSIVGNLSFTEVYYPLLLQRAIEGVNLTSGVWIQILLTPDNGGSVAWKPFIKSDNFQGLNGDLFLWVDQAKESALRYIWEQERSKG